MSFLHTHTLSRRMAENDSEGGKRTATAMGTGATLGATLGGPGGALVGGAIGGLLGYASETEDES
ncbi:hypothetical protein [Halolamina salina]|uniref:Glycine zipper domain-containing protein n=1 Tax=Halolamina salina TaxID=1220023 RepID=A0ABD6BB23_9EURY